MNQKPVQYAAYILLSSFLLFSCGPGKNKTTIKTKDGEVTISDLKNAGEQMKDAMDEAQKKREERKAKGDTLAISYKDLQKYLPSPSGYKKEGDASGESVNMPGLGSWSKAEQRYKSGDKDLNIELMDYNQSELGYTAAAGMFGMNIQVENDNEKSGAFETGISGVKGYEHMYKKDKRAELTYTIANRFILTLNLNGSNDIEELKNIAKSMNLGELASK
ncbi:MAG: hypothetical protein K2X48_20565 [Chitinophagaceae bacterium]|nr:hypothetical protein [Chitinophagaceae bacterium]